MSPLNLSDPTAVLLEVSRALAKAGVETATYGGLALAMYGEPRETKDADLAIAATDAPVLLKALEQAGFGATLAFERMKFGGNWVTRFTLLPTADHAGLNTADLVEPRSPRLARLVQARALEGRLGGEPIRVVTPEDFVVLKLLSTRARDLEDARSVIRSLGSKFDRDAVAAEVKLLVDELPDVDVRVRHEKMNRED